MRREGPGVYGPYKHGGKFRVHFVTRSGGTRKTTYETFDTRGAALACLDAARDEAQGITVSAAIKAFLDVTRARGRAELTVVAYEQRLNSLLSAYLHRPVRAVAHRGAELYAAVLEGRTADSHQNLLTAGKLWAKFCVRQKWLKSDPFAGVEPVGQRTHGADKERLTVDESRKLEAWCLAHGDDQAAVLTLGYLYLGSRNTELAVRDVRDLDDDGRLLLIGKTKSRAGRRKLRIPEVLSELLRALVAGRAPDDPIFVDANGNRMSRNVARKRVRAVLAAAGVRVLPPQALRRTQASLATEAGETALAVARHLGHAVGAAPRVTGQAYIERDAASAAQGERALKVLQGGKR